MSRIKNIMAEDNKKLEFDLEFLEKNGSGQMPNKGDAAQKPPQKDRQVSDTVNVRPWVRYWARYLDIVIFSIVFGLFLGFLMPSVIDSMSAGALGLLLLFVWIFVESSLLSTWGTTPGKWLLRVQLKDTNGEMPKFSKALNRSFAVCFKGLGVGIPIITLFTMIAAYNRLTKHGITSWDEDGRFTITHGKIGIIRTIVAIGIFGAFLFLIALGYE